MIKTTLIIGYLLTALCTNAQKANWQNLDLESDSVFGISTEKAYKELLKNRKSEAVVVAVVDSGIDTAHEDLKMNLWTDKKTATHGWNYIGAETGKEDVTNLVAEKKEFYDSLSYTIVPEQYRNGYRKYRQISPALDEKIMAMNDFIDQLEKTDGPGSKDLTAKAKYHLQHGLNINNNEPDTANGDSDVTPDKIDPLPNPNLTPHHGTHVAGIIAAQRNNHRGMDGIADNAQIMMLKANGNIRELRDAALASAIIFAVDHGARIINLSFGKPYTWNKKAVDKAVQYAMNKDVLIIHAAGNSGENLDAVSHYPNPVYSDNHGKAEAWIEVGASGPKDDNTLAADFSNYGKITVDVFAPGANIYSTIPGNSYESYNGTSMAAPVVSGLAALIREYYPKLTAVQVKEIIMRSVVKRDILKDKCISGGIVNAYSALKLASAY